MLHVERIKSFSVDDLIVINDLLEIAKRAKEITKLIKETYTFSSGEQKIKVLDDGKNCEYLTDDRWFIEHENLSTSLPVDKDIFYEILRSDYLVSHGFCNKYDGGITAEIINSFKAFVLRTQQLSNIKKVN